MNKEIFEGNWHEIKGHLKQHWGKLTDDEITEIEGSLEKLAGTLEKKYGYQKEQVQKEIQAFLDKNNWKDKFILKENWPEIKQKMQHQWEKLTEEEINKIQGSYEQLAKTLEEKYNYHKEQAQKQIQTFLDKNNWKS